MFEYERMSVLQATSGRSRKTALPVLGCVLALIALLSAGPAGAASKGFQVFDILTEAGFLSDDGNGGSFGGASARRLAQDKDSALVSIVADPATEYGDTSSVKQCAARLDAIFFLEVGMDSIVTTLVTQGKAVGLAGNNLTVAKEVFFKWRSLLALGYCLSLSEANQPTINGILAGGSTAANTALGAAIWTWLSGTTEGEKISELLTQDDADAGAAYLEQWASEVRRLTVGTARSTEDEQMADGMTNEVLIPLNETLLEIASTMKTEIGALITAYAGDDAAAKQNAVTPILNKFASDVVEVAKPFYNAYFGYRLKIPESATGYADNVYTFTFKTGITTQDAMTQSLGALAVASTLPGWFALFTDSSTLTGAFAANTTWATVVALKDAIVAANDCITANPEVQNAPVVEADLSVVITGYDASKATELLEEGKDPRGAAFPKMLYNKYAVTLPAIALAFATYVVL